MSSKFVVTQSEIEVRNQIIERILDSTAQNITIKLPDFDAKTSLATPETAAMTVGIEPNNFGATLGEFRYQFEGEEDLLHLIVTKLDLTAVTMPEAQMVGEFLLKGVPHNLVWIKPGEFTQHFYVGHDDVEKYVERTIKS